ncbi:hypothetical protein Lal_00036282 [Lupinus albus]|nr:hypothetical protein Lal_00036282 [Lupinus albus]
MTQPPTSPGPHERTLRELTAPDFTYDSLCIQYNPGWRNHQNLKWSDHTQQQPPHAAFQNNNAGHSRPYVPPPIQQQRQQQVINNPPPAPSVPSLEELVRQMTMQNMQLQQETRASIQRQESSIQNLTTQMEQMATSLNTLQSQNSSKLPSQTVINPKNVSAITLSSGKQTELATSTPDNTLQKVDDIGRHIHASTPSSSAAQ